MSTLTSTVTGQVRSGALKALMTGFVVHRRLQGDAVARIATPAGRANPYPVYRHVRETGRLVPSMIGLLTAHHDLCEAVLRDHEAFGSAPVPVPPRRPPNALGRMIQAIATEDVPVLREGRRPVSMEFDDVPDPLGDESMIGMDPPDHTRIRRMMSRAFTPRAVARVRSRVEEVAEELLDQAPRTDFELMSGYAGVLPVVVISELLGIPTKDWERVKAWGDVLATGLDVIGAAPPSQVAPALRGLADYLTELFEQRRREPGDLVIDTLIAGSGPEVADGLTDRELMATATLLLTAGFETTVNLIGNGVRALIEHPDQRALVQADPELMPNAVEEVLRWEPSVQMTSRLARRDTELAGRPVRKGTSVIVMLAGANRDPDVFADPDRFDVTRANAREHLSFAAGVHYCVGASLARLEAEVALRALFRRYPDLALSGRITPGKGLILRGPRRLPLRLQP